MKSLAREGDRLAGAMATRGPVPAVSTGGAASAGSTVTGASACATSLLGASAAPSVLVSMPQTIRPATDSDPPVGAVTAATPGEREGVPRRNASRRPHTIDPRPFRPAGAED